MSNGVYKGKYFKYKVIDSVYETTGVIHVGEEHFNGFVDGSSFCFRLENGKDKEFIVNTSSTLPTGLLTDEISKDEACEIFSSYIKRYEFLFLEGQDEQ